MAGRDVHISVISGALLPSFYFCLHFEIFQNKKVFQNTNQQAKVEDACFPRGPPRSRTEGRRAGASRQCRREQGPGLVPQAQACPTPSSERASRPGSWETTPRPEGALPAHSGPRSCAPRERPSPHMRTERCPRLPQSQPAPWPRGCAQHSFIRSMPLRSTLGFGTSLPKSRARLPLVGIHAEVHTCTRIPYVTICTSP